MTSLSLPFPRLLLLLFLLMLLGAGCSSSRKVLRTPPPPQSAAELTGKLKMNELPYEWFSAKFSAEYRKNRKETSFNGHIRVRKDSLIWMSLTPMLGIEALRVVITQDSVKMINRLNDTWFAGDYAYINRFLGTNIDYDLLQAFLLGHDLHQYDTTRFRAAVDGTEYKLSSDNRRKLERFSGSSVKSNPEFIQNLWLDPETYRITRADVSERGREQVRLESSYGDFSMEEGRLVPHQMLYTIRADGTIRVTAGFSRIVIDEPLQFPFRVPDDFVRVTE